MVADTIAGTYTTYKLGSAVFDIQRPKNHASSGLLISQ
jgi:hypothetical protein